MRRVPRVLAVLLPALAASSWAQTPLPSTRTGDYVVSNSGGNLGSALLLVPRVGASPRSVSTLLAFPAGAALGPVLMDFNNRDYVAVLGLTLARVQFPSATVSTIATIGSRTAAIALHQDGGYRLVTSTGELLAVTRSGVVQTLRTGLPPVNDFAVDLKSGDYLVATFPSPPLSSGLLRMGRRPPFALSTIGTLPVIRSFVQDRDRAGSIFAVSTNRLLRIDRITGNAVNLGSPRNELLAAQSVTLLGENHPDGRRNLAVVGNSAVAPGLFLFDGAGSLVTTISALPFSGVTVLPNRHREISGAGTALPGSTYLLFFSGPTSNGDDPHDPYVAACSWDTDPGILLSDGRKIPLQPDPLFFLSLTGIPMFQNFVGVLNSSGVAEPLPSVEIPAEPALIGFRFYISYVSINAAYPNNIGVIADPWGITIGG